MVLSFISDVIDLSKILQSTAALVIVACSIIIVIVTFSKFVLPKFKEVSEAVKDLKGSFKELGDMHIALREEHAATVIRMNDHNKEAEKTFDYMVSYMSEMKTTQLSITDNLKHISEILYTMKGEHDFIKSHCINMDQT